MYTGRRILVVDDEPLIASLIADWLVELGHEVIGPVSDAAAALEASAQSKPHAALLDVTLRDGDSFALAEALTAQGVNVAFVTGHDAQSLSAQCGGAPVLGKPFDFGAVKTLLDRLLRAADGVPPAE